MRIRGTIIYFQRKGAVGLSSSLHQNKKILNNITKQRSLPNQKPRWITFSLVTTIPIRAEFGIAKTREMMILMAMVLVSRAFSVQKVKNRKNMKQYKLCLNRDMNL
jgi:hypothetical protein